jgi:enamine deaminase RidA (YjgF/YER057c/UK114 family)
MDVPMIAVLPVDGRDPRASQLEGVPVPQHSGFIASLISGDYVFVAGQMPNNEDMTGIAKPAYRPPNAVWNGTDIRLQAQFLIASRLSRALEAGGSSLRNAVKAQVYLTSIDDLPEFMDVWNGHFGEHPCALTVVATKGLALPGSILEINIFGVREGKDQKQIIDPGDRACAAWAAAVRAGDLLCLSALCAADAQNSDASGFQRRRECFGAPPSVRCARSLRRPADLLTPRGRRWTIFCASAISWATSTWFIRRCVSGRSARGRAHSLRRGAHAGGNAGPGPEHGRGHVGLCPVNVAVKLRDTSNARLLLPSRTRQP